MPTHARAVLGGSSDSNIRTVPLKSGRDATRTPLSAARHRHLQADGASRLPPGVLRRASRLARSVKGSAHAQEPRAARAGRPASDGLSPRPPWLTGRRPRGSPVASSRRAASRRPPLHRRRLAPWLACRTRGAGRWPRGHARRTWCAATSRTVCCTRRAATSRSLVAAAAWSPQRTKSSASPASVRCARSSTASSTSSGCLAPVCVPPPPLPGPVPLTPRGSEPPSPLSAQAGERLYAVRQVLSAGAPLHVCPAR